MIQVTNELINQWADRPEGPVALYLKQKLLPVEGEGGVIFPPTYADIGYNIDTLADGTKVATIDSVGSQANRIEPVFMTKPYSALVPQIEIEFHQKEKDGEKYVEKRSLLELAHRGADAAVYSTPTLASDVSTAFRALRQRRDAGPLTRLAPTSLVFGVWDSRGESGEKCPRLVRSIIRAWNVDELHSAAQFNSMAKALSEEQKAELEKDAKAKKVKLSVKGFADAPATFRKVSDAAARQMTEFRNGSPNPERRVLGGVLSSGEIRRDVTVNLVALRALRGGDDNDTQAIRRYLLSLALIAATTDIDLFLREGCHLRYAGDDAWLVVPRRGKDEGIDLSSDQAKKTVVEYAMAAVKPFKNTWPKTLSHKFDMKEAKKILSKKGEEDEDQS